MTLDGLEKLFSSEPSEHGIAPGKASFTIPRDLFDNRLGSFAKELNFINQLIEHMSEAVTGDAQPVELEGLSSSTPTVAVAAGLGVLKLLGSVINSFLDAWEKVQKIRGLREQLKEVGVSTAAAEELTEKITTTVEEVVEESTRLILVAYSKDGGRRNELENALKGDMRRLFGQIERGLTVEIRTHKAADVDDSYSEDAKAIDEIARTMRFPVVSREPMLLTPGEVLDGEITRVRITTKKTTTDKTSKRSPQSAAKEERRS